jgi:hypothetical protein
MTYMRKSAMPEEVELEKLRKAAELLIMQLDLWNICKKFIKKHEISTSEDIYQKNLDFYGLVENICEVVGYQTKET